MPFTTMWHQRSRYVLWAWLASVGLVVAGSLPPNLHIKPPVDNPDKLLHAAAYTRLAFLPRIGFLSSSQTVYLGLGLLCLVLDGTGPDSGSRPLLFLAGHGRQLGRGGPGPLPGCMD